LSKKEVPVGNFCLILDGLKCELMPKLIH